MHAQKNSEGPDPKARPYRSVAVPIHVVVHGLEGVFQVDRVVADHVPLVASDEPDPRPVSRVQESLVQVEDDILQGPEAVYLGPLFGIPDPRDGVPGVLE